MSVKSFVKRIANDILSGVEAELRTRINPAEDISSPKGSDGNFVPGDIEILAITMVSGKGDRVQDLMPYVTEMHIYESIIYPTMFCELFIADSIKMYEGFPIVTDEYVTIVIRTPGNEIPSTYIFSVKSVGNKEILQNNKLTKYTMQLISPELKRSMAEPITKTFKGTISELVQEILEEDIKTQKPLIIEPSTGIIDKTIGPRFPFSMIHEHYLDADNRRDNNGVYVFFENKHGYNLVTYEKLIKDGRKSLDRNGSSKRFVFTPDRNSDTTAVKFRNILAYNQSTFCDAASILAGGALGSSAQLYDFSKGPGDRAQYKESENGGDTPTSDTNGTLLIGTDFIRQYEKNNINNMLIAVNSEVRPNNKIAEVLVRRNAFLRKLQQIEAQIMIYGDTDLAVGDVIECSFPSSSDADNDPGKTRLDSGNYLITHLRHIIVVSSNRPQHAIACNLMKAGMLGR